MAVEESDNRCSFDEDEAYDFAHVTARDKVLEGLVVGEDVVGVEVLVPAGGGEDFPAEHAEFGVGEDVGDGRMNFW